MVKKIDTKWLESMGIKLKPEDFADNKVETQESTKERSRWEAESTLKCLKWPYPELVSKKCITCSEKFLTNYEATAYCSNACVKKDFEKHGLLWNPNKSFHEQWGLMEPPLIVPPAALKAMRRLLNLLEQETHHQIDNQEPDYEDEHTEYQDDVLSDPQVPYNDPEIQEEPESDLDARLLDMLNALDD